MKREVEIHIKPNGKVLIAVRGVPGKECIDFTRFLEEALGEEVSKELTSEYYIEVVAAERPVLEKEPSQKVDE